MLEFLSGRASRMAASAVALSAVVGGTVAYANTSKTITLTVDGQSRTVEAGADTVQALLADENLSVGSHDLVSLAGDARLEEGQEVVVKYGRPVELTVDGKSTTLWTTERTLAGALSALGVRSEGARLSVSRSQPVGRQGLAVDLFTPKKVTVAADGRTRAVTTTAATVGDLLAERKVRVRPHDRLSLARSAPLVDGLAVRLTRIDRKQAVSWVTVASRTSNRPTASLYRGETKVLSPGRDGRRRMTYALLYVDGELMSRSIAKSYLAQPPARRIVQVGTKVRPVVRAEAPPRAVSSPRRSRGSGGGSGSGSGGSAGGRAAGLNWASLAKCESGGNPRAVNPNGHYGLYQFSLSTWRSVGGSGNPIDNSAGEQTYRAQVLYNKAGAGQWSCGSHLFD